MSCKLLALMLLTTLLLGCSQTMMFVQSQVAFVVDPEAHDTSNRIELIVQSRQTGPELHDYATAVVVSNFSSRKILVTDIQLSANNVLQAHVYYPQEHYPVYPIEVAAGTSVYFPVAFITQDDLKRTFDRHSLAMLLVHYKGADGNMQLLWTGLSKATLY